MESGHEKKVSAKEGISDDPPAFEEMMRTPVLFYMFLQYLTEQMATENLFFLQIVRCYKSFSRPQPEVDIVGRKIMSIFCLPGAPAEVNISSETRSSLSQAFLQPCLRSSVYTPTLFDTAYFEIRTLLAQPYSSWIATNEWKKREILKNIRRLKPPTFTTVLNNGVLSDMFLAFLREKTGEKSEEVDSFLFCLEAEKFRMNALSGNHQRTAEEPTTGRKRKMSDASAIALTVKVPDSSGRFEYNNGNNSDDERKSDVRSRRSSEAAAPSRDEELIMGTSETVDLERTARSIVKRHKLPKKSKQLSYRLHLSAQNDRFVSIWAKHELFVEWQQSKQWADVSFKDSVSLRQTRNAAGMLEYPTLAATIVSLINDPHRSGNGLGVLFKFIMNFSSHPKDLEFMEAVLKFRKRFSSPNVDKDEMAGAAISIFNQYLAPVKVCDVSPHSPCPQFLSSSPLLPRLSTSGPNSPNTSPSITATSSSPELGETPLVLLDNTIANEIRGIVWTAAKTKVHVDMFRRAATYIFYQAQNTWFRELCASLVWVGREYENVSEQTERVRTYFGDFSIISDVIENQPLHILYDDIVENSTLNTKFRAHVPSTRKPILDILDHISVFRFKPVQTLKEACALRDSIQASDNDNVVVLKLVRNMSEYLNMATVAAPFSDFGSSASPSAETALVNSSIFDFVRSSLYRQLLAECGEKFIATLRPSKMNLTSPSRLASFFRFVEPLHEVEIALTTKSFAQPVQSQLPSVHSSSGPSSKNSSSNGGGSSGPGSGVRTPIVSVLPVSFSLDGVSADGEEPPPSLTTPGKRTSIFNFSLFRNGRRHSPLVKHVRTPGSFDSSSVRSPDNLYSSPKVSTVSEPASLLAQDSTSSMVMNIPSFEQVLGSSYFRQMLTDVYFCRVEENESNAWDDLTIFYSKWSKLDDCTLAKSQEAIIENAKEVLHDNSEFLSTFTKELESLISSDKPIFVTANFFRKAERELFQKAYTAFVVHLQGNGWKTVPVAEDDLMLL